MNDAWKEYKGDFNSLTDSEVEQELEKAIREMEEAEGWIEAVTSWKAAGKPRNKKDDE